MKKILLFFTIAGAMFFSNALCAHDVKLEGFNITQHDNTVGYGSLSSANTAIDYFFSYISDNDTDDSEKKKVPSGKTSHTNTYFATPNFSIYDFKNILPTKLFVPFRTSLFLFNGVLRI